MEVLQRSGISLPIATATLGTILALVASMGLFNRKNQMPVEGRVRHSPLNFIPKHTATCS